MLFGAASAYAQAIVLPPVPLESDSWISLNPTNLQLVGPFSITEQQEVDGNGFFANTGIQVTDANGRAIRLSEGSTGYSDYVYAVAGFLYFSSDDDNGNIPIHPSITNGVAGLDVVATLNETGNWQNITPYFDFTLANTQAWVASDVPELSTWAMLLLGFAGVVAASFKSKRPWAAKAPA
jgi:hypothetical protein